MEWFCNASGVHSSADSCERGSIIVTVIIPLADGGEMVINHYYKILQMCYDTNISSGISKKQ